MIYNWFFCTLRSENYCKANIRNVFVKRLLLSVNTMKLEPCVKYATYDNITDRNTSSHSLCLFLYYSIQSLFAMTVPLCSLLSPFPFVSLCSFAQTLCHACSTESIVLLNVGIQRHPVDNAVQRHSCRIGIRSII